MSVLLGGKGLKARHVVIENFRSIRKLEFDLQDLTMFIGENNTGKTNIMKALELFFTASIKDVNEEDFYQKNSSSKENSIRITITFCNLTEQERERLGKYLVGTMLTVCKTITYDADTQKFASKWSGLVREPKQYFLKLSKFDEYKHRLGDIVRENNLPDYFKAETGRITQDSYKAGVERYTSENSATIEWDEPILSDSFFGWKEVPQGYLPDFICVPAVRDIEEESKFSTATFFGRLLNAIFERVEKESERIGELREQVEHLRSMLNPPSTTGVPDRRLREIKEFESNLSQVLQESMPDTRIRVQFQTPELSDILRVGARLRVDDGIETDIAAKGHGLQRAMIFAIFRVYADFLKKAETTTPIESLIFAIEEPELYLHPHSQRKMLEVLKAISHIDQVMICTHSTYFIDMSLYKSLGAVTKRSVSEGTRLFQCTEEIFEEDERASFRAQNEFDPERNEIFFAKKVLLVEGDTEKVVLPLVAKKMGHDFNTLGISTIEAGSKDSLRIFIKIMNKFRIPYLVVHDSDFGKPEEAENERIIRLIDQTLGSVQTVDPDFDSIIDLQVSGRMSKPFEAFTKFKDVRVEDIPQRVKEVVTKLVTLHE